MVVTAAQGMCASLASAWIAADVSAGVVLAFGGCALIGVRVAASGMSLLVQLAYRVDDSRYAPAAAIVWIVMTAGFAIDAARGVAASPLLACSAAFACEGPRIPAASLVSGLLLVFALRAALVGAGAQGVGPWLAAAFVAHLADMAIRFRR